MNRLLALFALLLPLLFAAAPAYGVMLRAEKSAVPDFFWPSQLASGDEPPCSQDCTMDAAIYGYDFAEDVRVGPNLYAYVKQNPWSAYDAEGLFLNFIAGAVIGAAIDAGAQLLTEGKISSWSSIAVSAGMGVTGVGLGNVVAKTAAKTALTKGAQLAVRIGANAASGAVEGATEQLVRNAVDGKSLTDGVGKSALVGMASSVGGDAAGAGLKKLMGPSAGDLRDLANETLALQKGADGFKTVGAASAKDINGKNQILVASSDTQLSPLQRRYVENRGGIPVRDAPGTKNHAEVTIMNHADSNNMTIQKIETTRPICTTCEPKVKEREIETTSPFKSDEKK